MSDGNLNRIRQRELEEQHRSMIALVGLAIVILVVIMAVAIAR